MLDVIKSRKIWYVVSSLIIAVGILSIILYGLNLGIDFKGGSLSEVKIEQEVGTEDLKNTLQTNGFTSANVQPSENNAYIIRTAHLSQEKHNQLLTVISEKYGSVEELRFDSIGPTISKEITQKAIYQLLLVAVGILLYIAWAFRTVPKPLSSWKFGLTAIVALIHDLLIVVGVFAILGKFLNVEIDALFVTALLTVLGFSVHDTIIVFDRIRENLKRLAGEPFENVVSRSINQTLVRSINTSTTVIFVLVALLLFGGASIKFFVLALIIGVTAGTYSSIFVASPLLYEWHKNKLN